MISIKKFFKKNKGQAAVETALIIPIVLFILLTIVEFGRIFNAYIIVSNASREGARYAAVGRSYDDIETIVDNITASLNDVEVSFSPSNENDRIPGQSVKVNVHCSLPLITPIVGPLISETNSFDVKSNTIMRVE